MAREPKLTASCPLHRHGCQSVLSGSMVDDDAPLSELKTMQFDDDMPLASLATSTPQKPSKAATAKGKGKGGAKGKAKVKAAAKRSVKESSSSSSSSSGSDSDSSEGGEGEQKPKKVKVNDQAKRMQLLKKKRKEAMGETAEDEDADEDIEDAANNVVKKRDRTTKQQAVSDLLCRWWYVLPDWPPNNKDFYAPRLEERKLRQVTIQEWEWVDDKDSRGFAKVYQLSQFPGVFRDSHGQMIDLRPQEDCPCYANFMKKDLSELYDLLAKAYAAQLQELETSRYNEDKLKKELTVALNRVKDKGYQASQLTGPKRSRTV